MTASFKAHAQIHFCVMLWGFTSIFGRLITLHAVPLVWWRMVIVASVLSCVPSVWRGLRGMRPRLVLAYAGIGLIISLHWLTFYEAIKLADASVGATTIALAPVFLALGEPLIARRRMALRELLLGATTVVGVALVVGGIPSGMRLGVWVGVASALLVSFFAALNKRLVEKAKPLVITWIELSTGALFITALAPLLPHTGPAFPLPSRHDLALLMALCIGCTLVPFSLALVALRQLSAFGAQLVVNLEPVYAIFLAILLLGEQRQLTPTFYLGVAVIIGAVFAHPWLARLGAKRGLVPSS